MKAIVIELTDEMMADGTLIKTLNDNFRELNHMAEHREKQILGKYAEIQTDIKQVRADIRELKGDIATLMIHLGAKSPKKILKNSK